MERRQDRDHLAGEPFASSMRRRRRHLAMVRKSTYTVDELPALIETLRHEEVSIEEIERRRRLAERADRWRAEMPVIETPVKDWIRRERGEELLD